MQVIRKCFGKYRFDKFTALPFSPNSQMKRIRDYKSNIDQQIWRQKVDPDTTMNDHKTWHQIR